MTEGVDVIEKPAAAALGRVLFAVVSLRVVAVTVKLAQVESPLGVLAAITRYRPAVTFATTKEPDKVPLKREQVGEATA